MHARQNQAWFRPETEPTIESRVAQDDAAVRALSPELVQRRVHQQRTDALSLMLRSDGYRPKAEPALLAIRDNYRRYGHMPYERSCFFGHERYHERPGVSKRIKDELLVAASVWCVLKCRFGQRMDRITVAGFFRSNDCRHD